MYSYTRICYSRRFFGSTISTTGSLACHKQYMSTYSNARQVSALEVGYKAPMVKKYKSWKSVSFNMQAAVPYRLKSARG